MVNAMANSTVPKFTIITGNSYGAGNYAMCGKAYDPRLIYAWPTAEIAVMSGASAAKTLLQIKLSSFAATIFDTTVLCFCTNYSRSLSRKRKFEN